MKDFDASYPDGLHGTGRLLQTADGFFYGTAVSGGRFGLGTIFRIDGAGSLTTLHHFSGADGAGPQAGVIQAQDGTFYGITQGGGAFNAGTVFRLDGAGTLTTVHQFAGFLHRSPGVPRSLIQATDGNFYGTADRGIQQLSGCVCDPGIVFGIDATGVLTTLYEFTGGRDGGQPRTLMQASDGRFYGTTVYEPSNFTFPGAIFRIDAAGTFTRLHGFTQNEGWDPSSGVIESSDGNFYGTTAHDPTGVYTVYRVDSAGRLTTLYRVERGYTPSADKPGLRPGIIEGTDGFLYAAGFSAAGITVFKLDGAGPPTTPGRSTARSDAGWAGTRALGYAPKAYSTPTLIQASDGAFYSATSDEIFRLDPAGARTTVYRFRPGGGSVLGGLIEDPDGSLIGASTAAGSGSTATGGSIFKLDAAGTLMTLHRFAGSVVTAALAQGPDRTVYGVTSGPAIFKLDATGLTTLHRFDTAVVSGVGAFTLGPDGTVYGTATGSCSCVFSLAPSGAFATFQFSPRPRSVIKASDGSLYGIATGGEPAFAWFLYRLDATGTMTVLYRHPLGSSNEPPLALIQGSDGAFYGTTPGSRPSRPGTIFRIDPSGGLTTLHGFGDPAGGTDASALIQTRDGSFYGTTPRGGLFGGGTVFRLDPAGTFTTVHNFRLDDGTQPQSGVIQGADGNLYGTTTLGGARGGGTIFRLRPAENRAPVAHPQTVVAAEDTALNIQLTAADADGDPLTFFVVTPPQHGVLAGVAPHLTYTPAADYSGPDSFAFTVHDGVTGSTAATVAITVTPTPAPRIVHAVPGHINAEDYGPGGPGVSYFDTTPGNIGGARLRSDDVDVMRARREGGFAIGWFAAGEWLAYTIDVARDGVYAIRTRVGSALPNRTFHFELDGRAVTGAVPVPQMSAWDSYGTVNVPGIPLPAGIHVLRVVMGPNEYMDLKGFDIVPDQPALAVPGRIEAEDYDAGGPGVGYIDTTPGTEGGAYRLDDVDLKLSREGGVAVGWLAAGEWLAYTVDVARASVYTLHARVGSLLPGRSFHIEVDGQDLTGPLAVPQFADWDLYDIVRAPGVRLSAGRHVLRVVMGPEDFMDFDALTIVEGADVPAGGPPQWSGPIEFADELSLAGTDRFEFSVSERQRVVVHATSTSVSFDPCLRVFDLSGDPVSVQVGYNGCGYPAARLDLTLDAGTYVLEVSDYGGNQAGSYRLQYYPVVAGTAGPLIANGDLSTAISRGHFDVHTFTLTAPTRVRLTASSKSIEPCLRLLRAADDLPVANGTSCSLLVSQLDVALGAGVYFVEVSDRYNMNTGEYTLIFNPLVTADATPLAPGATIAADLTLFGDHDLFAFTLPAAARVTVQAASSDNAACFALLAGPGATVPPPSTSCPVMTRDLTAGTYFVDVFEAGPVGNVVPYTLSLSTGP